MNEYLADGSAIELNKEQLEIYKQNNSLYMQERIKFLEQILNKIEEYCKHDIHKFSDGITLRYTICDNILDIIHKAKEKKCNL